MIIHLKHNTQVIKLFMLTKIITITFLLIYVVFVLFNIIYVELDFSNLNDIQ